MNNIFLLIISLLIGFEASEVIKECPRYSTKFNCKQHSDRHSDTQTMRIFTTYKEQPSYSLSHYVKNQKLFLVELFKSAPQKIQIEADGCKPSGTAKQGTITCKDPNQSIKFICSYKDLFCEEFSRQSQKCSIEAPADNAGIYKCKAKEKLLYKNNKPDLILSVPDVTTFTKSAKVGKTITYYCKYDEDVKHSDLFICKGEDPTTCQFVGNATTTAKNTKFNMQADRDKHNTTIIMEDLKASDSGTYWCGAEIREPKSRIFISRCFLIVVPKYPALSTASPIFSEATSTSPASLPATTGARVGLGPGVIPSIIIGAVGLLLILLVIVIFALYKRCVHSEKAHRSAEQHPEEDYIYEEIPDVLQTQTTSVYATAKLPTDDPASLHYSTMIFQTTEQADGEALIMKPSSSSCQYSALKCSQSPTSLTDPPTRSTAEPLYSLVQKPH